MIKRNTNSGSRKAAPSLWQRVAQMSGFSRVFGPSKTLARAKTSRIVARKRKTAAHSKNKRGAHATRKHSGKAHRGRRVVRHRALHRTVVRRRSQVEQYRNEQPASAQPAPTSPKGARFGLPKILFKEIIIPYPHFSTWSRFSPSPSQQNSKVISPESPAEKTNEGQQRTAKDSPQGDLADLLGDASKETSASRKEQPKEQNTVAQNPSTVGKEESPSPTRVRQDASAAVDAAVMHKRKQAEAREMALQQSFSPKEKKEVAEKEKHQQQERIEKDKRSEADAQAALERLGDAGRVVKKRRSFKTFLRSINNIGMGKQRAAFVQNLAMMLDAGLPLIDAIKTIQDEVRSKPMRAVLQRILDLVEGGNPLWVSMEEQGLFTQYEVSLVRVGEEAGNLARNMELLSIQQEKDRNLRQKVKMAMIYPAIVMTLMFIVVMGLGIFVLPNLIQVLYALNVELPLSTRIVVAFTEFMQVYGMSTAGGMIAGAFVLLMLTKYTSFKVVTQWFIFHIPGIGSLAKEASIARFGVILGGLLQAGVPLVESMESLVNVTTMVSFRRFYQKVLDRIIVGDSFAISFHSIRGSRKVIPGSVQQLIITGEKSGALSDTCIKVAQIYERKAEETAEKLPVILEPTLLLMIGALVGFIAFSIIVPIYSAVGNVGGA